MARPANARVVVEDNREKAWRPCLGPTCDHVIFTTKAVRICARGHAEIAGVEIVYGAEDRGPLIFSKARQRITPYNMAATMVEA